MWEKNIFCCIQCSKIRKKMQLEKKYSSKPNIKGFGNFLIKNIIFTLLYSLTIEQFLMQLYLGCTLMSNLIHSLMLSNMFSAGGGAIYDAPKARGGAIFVASKPQVGAIFVASRP